MSPTTAQAFTSFLASITITEYQKTSIVNARRQTVATRLGGAFPESSDLPFTGALLIGSASKGTIVRPLDDIDVLAVFSNKDDIWRRKYWNDSASFIYRIRRAYDGVEIAQVGTRGQAIRVFFQTGGHVDIAPVFRRDNDTYHLPSGAGDWILTSPFVANRWFAEKNAERNYHLAPLVRLLKKWNGAHSQRLRSFHLETMAAHTFSSLGSNYRDALQKFFSWAPGRLDVSDPGGRSGLLSSYLTWPGRSDVVTSLNSAADRAQRALDAEAAGDHAEAIRLWKIILGPSFS